MSQTQIAAQKSHPKGLYILFATEMWERFNYYGMRAVLVLFMTKALVFDKAFASNLYGSYTGLVYLTPLIGGFIADRYWGNKRSIIAGGLLMAMGEFILFFCGSLYASNPGLSSVLFFSGLGFMIAGNGFFKPNISSLVGQLYPDGDRRKDAAYTIFYMGINVGGALGPIVCAFLGDTGDPADFKWAFLAGGIAMLLSVIVQWVFQEKYVVDPQGKSLGMVPADSPYIDATKFSFLTYLLLASAIFIIVFILSDKTLTKIEKERVIVILIVSFFVIFFWSAFEQAGASLTFFADEQTNRDLNWDIPKLIIYLLGIALVFYLGLLLKKATSALAGTFDKQLRLTVQALLAAAIGTLVYLMFQVATNGTSSIFIGTIPASAFASLNSIYVVSFAPVFAWLWIKMGKREPSSPTKMAIGLMLLALGYLWIAQGVDGVQPGIKVSMIWLLGMYAMHTWGELCLSPIGLSLVNKLAPLKYASLLMAVWFLANAVANKFAGVLSALYPDGKSTYFLGYEIANNYDFFLLFVGMAGVASLILFGLTKKLQKMMHEKTEV